MSTRLRIVIGGGLSAAPENKHPWFKYYREKGISRPPIVKPAAAPPSPPAAATDAGAAPAGGPPVSDELAAAVAAATAELPGTTAAPFITFMQREAAARELRRQARRRWLGRGVAGVVALMALHFAVTRFFYRAPSEAALQTFAEALGRAVAPLHSSAQHPLQPAGTTVTLTDRVSSSRIRYAAEVTLRLKQPLYMPAVTNGTAVYRQMQQSLWAAQEQDLKLKLFEGKDGPPAPELPLLILVAHRAGDRLVVRVPFEARRFGWHWRIEPAPLALRSTDRTFDGFTLEHYAGAPYLVFGAPGTLADIRRRTQLARAYVLAVAKEVQKRADVEAVGGTMPVAPAWANLPALDGNTPAVEEVAGRPAMPAAAKAPAIDPNAPAVDPDLPAVPPPKPDISPEVPALLDRSTDRRRSPPARRNP